MIRKLAVIGCVLLFVVLSYAQEPTNNPNPATREQIIKMMDAMQARNTVQSVMQSMQNQMGAMIEQQIQKNAPQAPPELRAEMSSAMQDMLKDMEPLMSDMMQDMIPIYQKYLSSREADAITAFYLSPEGKSFMTKMPQIMNESMGTAMKTLQAKMEPIQQKFTKRMEEITQKYAAQSTSAPKKSSTAPAK